MFIVPEESSEYIIKLEPYPENGKLFISPKPSFK